MLAPDQQPLLVDIIAKREVRSSPFSLARNPISPHRHTFGNGRSLELGEAAQKLEEERSDRRARIEGFGGTLDRDVGLG